MNMTANLKLLSLPAAVLAVAVMVSACGADNPDELPNAPLVF